MWFAGLPAALWLGLVSCPAQTVDPAKLPPPAPVKVDFARDIQPLLQSHCLKCHSDEKPKSGFRLTSRAAALQGGEHGVDIIPGDSARSPIIHYVSGLVEDMAMPPEGRGTPLTAQEIGLLRAWVDQGANWNAPPAEPASSVSVTPLAGFTTVSGDARKFRELYWQRDGWNGGLSDFEVTEKPTPDSKLVTGGHVALDDYRISLSAEQDSLGFTRFGWEQFRKYYDDAGGYQPLLASGPFELNRDLHMDRGRAWTELGLTLPRWPKLVVGYEYQYRDGSEATLQWGPVGNGNLTNSIYPGLKEVSERVHIVKFDAEYELAGTLFSDSFRGEWYRLDTRELNESGYTLGSGAPASAAAFTAATERQSYFQGANTFHVERQFTDWLFGAGGYLYSKLNANATEQVDNANTAALNLPSLFFPGYPGFAAPRLELERESHVFSLSGMAGPWEGFNLTFGTQNEWTRQMGLTFSQVTLALPFGVFPLDPETLHGDLDRRVFSQEAGLRFTKIPFTTLYADARFEQDDYGEHEEQTGGLTPFAENTDARSHMTDFRTGFNTSPSRRLSFSAQYRRYDNRTDYARGLKLVPPGNEGYPAFVRERDLFSQETEARLAFEWTAWLKTSLSYRWLGNEYRTGTEPVTVDPFIGLTGVSPGGQVLAGVYDAHITSLNATLTPWRRLFLSATVAYQNARTVTSAHGSPSVVPYAGDIYSAMAEANYALGERTRLTAGYSFSRGDFTQPDGGTRLPLGLDYSQHTLSAGMERRLCKQASLGLRYQYYRYREPSAGGASDFDAHAVFATLAWRWP